MTHIVNAIIVVVVVLTIMTLIDSTSDKIESKHTDKDIIKSLEEVSIRQQEIIRKQDSIINYYKMYENRINP